jgi:pimeloyl-ACP methyl ester carboxylesterase
MKKSLPFIYLIGFALIVLLFSQFRPDISFEELKKKYTDGRSQFIEIDGMKVHYRIEGSGTPLVLIHGTSSSLHTWEAWTAEMKNHFTIVRLDMPAFGLTGPNNDNNYTIDYYVDFLNRFLNQLKIDTFYLAGNSLGGNIAWSYAAQYPEKVKKLILLDASGYPKKKIPLIFRLAKYKPVAGFFTIFTPRYIVEKNMREVYYNPDKISDSLVTRYYEMSLRKGNREAFVARVKNLISDDYEKIKQVKCPTLIIWGKEDHWIPVEDAYRFHKDIQNSQLAIFDSTGHIPMEENPAPTAATAIEFLNN